MVTIFINKVCLTCRPFEISRMERSIRVRMCMSMSMRMSTSCSCSGQGAHMMESGFASSGSVAVVVDRVVLPVDPGAARGLEVKQN